MNNIFKVLLWCVCSVHAADFVDIADTLELKRALAVLAKYHDAIGPYGLNLQICDLQRSLTNEVDSMSHKSGAPLLQPQVPQSLSQAINRRVTI